jgi:hypothetical protein
LDISTHSHEESAILVTGPSAMITEEGRLKMLVKEEEEREK